MSLVFVAFLIIICGYCFFKYTNYLYWLKFDTFDQIILDSISKRGNLQSAMNFSTKNRFTFFVSQLVLSDRLGAGGDRESRGSISTSVRIPFNTSCVDRNTIQYIKDIVKLIEHLFIIDHYSVVRYSDSFKSISRSMIVDQSLHQEIHAMSTKRHNFVNNEQQQLFEEFFKKYSDQPYPREIINTTYSRLFFDRIELVFFNGELFLTCDKDGITFYSMIPGTEYVLNNKPIVVKSNRRLRIDNCLVTSI